MSVIGPRSLDFCLGVRLESPSLCGREGGREWPCLSREDMAWLVGIVEYIRCEHPANLRRWREMGIRPAIPSTPAEGEVLNAPVIHRAARLWSLPNLCKWYLVGAFL